MVLEKKKQQEEEEKESILKKKGTGKQGGQNELELEMCWLINDTDNLKMIQKKKKKTAGRRKYSSDPNWTRA